MRYNPYIHHRRSIRLKGYDYSSEGSYFITMCTQNRHRLFGRVVNGKMNLNDAGKMVNENWKELVKRFKNIELDAYVVMPDHFHSIITIHGPRNTIIQQKRSAGATLVVAPSGEKITNNPPNRATRGSEIKVPRIITNNPPNRATTRVAPTKHPVIGDMIGAFKSLTTVEYIRGVKLKKYSPFEKSIWQRDYWESIIRGEEEINRVRQYIINNPRHWRKN